LIISVIAVAVHFIGQLRHCQNAEAFVAESDFGHVNM
jgi:hypothetical protein